MKLGYSTWGMPKVPVDKALAHLAGLGFDGVELTVIPGYTTELIKLDAVERSRIRRLFRHLFRTANPRSFAAGSQMYQRGRARPGKALSMRGVGI